SNSNLKTFSVACKTSMTVLQALETSKMFWDEKNKNKHKEILIQRSKGILDIDFIQKDKNSSKNETTVDPSLLSNPETLVTIWVKKEGGLNVQYLLKSKALRKSVRYVCVFGFKGEKVKFALKRDGRFRDVIFKKHCGLLELVVLKYVTKAIVNSEEILGILRDQFPDLLKTLKKREKLKNKSEVKKFFREEYGKSVDNFLKVKKVKQLMKLSDSVCQIRKGGSPEGTGFLLFDRFILTNAHVIGLFTDHTKVNFAEFTAVFDYEDKDSEKRIQIKQLTDFCYGKYEHGRHLDYALLELNDSIEIAKYPQLLYSCSPNLPTNRRQICIVGHPGEGVKKMDPCIIIGTESRLDAAEKHKTEKAEFIHVMTEKSLEEKWDFHENQITYSSCFFHGSSGSPVFDADCNLIGIHTGGYVYEGQGKTTKSVMEYAYSIQPILNMIRAHAKMKDLKDLVKILEPYSDQSNASETPMEQN
uniref:Serine protease n=1 Tax=Cyprinus carpio TaxID=7962 RepID=A0A8C1XLZ3_CYPCA